MSIGKIKEPKGPSICNVCRRKKGKAIKEQKIAGEPCNLSKNFTCVFKKEIEDMLENPLFVVGEKKAQKKVEFKIGKTNSKFKVNKSQESEKKN